MDASAFTKVYVLFLHLIFNNESLFNAELKLIADLVISFLTKKAVPNNEQLLNMHSAGFPS